MYSVYVLQLADGSLYKGLTVNLNRRIKQHRSGKVAYTKTRLPFRIIISEEFSTRIEARNREKFYKSGEGREFLNTIK